MLDDLNAQPNVGLDTWFIFLDTCAQLWQEDQAL